MSDKDAEKRIVLQLDSRDYIENRLGSETWIIAYSSIRKESENSGYFCALAPNTAIEDELSRLGWGVQVGFGQPGFEMTFEDEKEIVTYYRFADANYGIEPLVLVRNFHNIRPTQIELLEEFRLFHNLYHDRRINAYYKIDDAGNETLVAEVTDEQVKIRTKEIRQFAGCKDMSLTCPPRTDPGSMLGSDRQGGRRHATQTLFPRRDHPQTARG